MRLGYLHLPRFPLQRRVLERPDLAHRPVVLWREERGAQQVAFASKRAQAAGVRAGMTVAQAAALEAGLERLQLQPADEARALHSLGEALLGLCPGFEVHGLEGLWLDAGAAKAAATAEDRRAEDALARSERAWAARVLECAAALGWRGQLAVASERFTALALGRLGAAGGPVFAAPTAAALLAPLSLDALELPGQLGPGAAGPFRALGLSTLGEVAALSAGAVVARYGSVGTHAQRLCRGEDDTPFVPDPLEEVLEEAVALEWPLEQLEPLLFALKAALDRLGARLSGRGRAAVQVRLRLTLDPAGSAEVPLVLARPSASAKLLLELFRHRLGELVLERPVVGLQVRVLEACEDPGRQLLLGDAPEGDAALEVVVSKLQSALGPDALFAAELHPQHRPEAAWAPGAFRPPGQGDGLAGRGRKGQPLFPPELKERPSRLLAQPVPLEVQLSAEGGLVAARVLGRRRKAQAVYGPERLCGGWWSPSPYARDYYRVLFDDVGSLWLYRDAKDGRFYLQGMFD